VWADLDGNNGNALLTRRVFLDGVDQPIARVVGTVVAWYLTDRLGSVRDIANNSTGVSIDHLDYDGFGNATESAQTSGDRYKFTARELDSESGFQLKENDTMTPLKADGPAKILWVFGLALILIAMRRFWPTVRSSRRSHSTPKRG
jgi:hypothetical protein